MAPGISSPTLATPRAAVSSLAPPSTMPLLSLKGKRPTTDGGSRDDDQLSQNGAAVGESFRGADGPVPGNGGEEDYISGPVEERADEEDAAYPDGRMTPMASESGVVSHSGSSGHSNHEDHSPNSTSISTASRPSQTSQQPLPTNATNEPALIGLCTLVTEEQLKESLAGQDRIFLLVLAKDIEAFVMRVINGEQQSLPPVITSTSAFAALGPSFILTAAATSKYQRMLVYKAAEWYGLKAVPGPDSAMIIGVLDTLDVKSPNLRLADLVPKPQSPKQNFRIMQRAANGSRLTDGLNGEPSEEGGSSKHKTLEEKQAEYELARLRIYGDSPKDGQSGRDEQSLDDYEIRGRTARRYNDEPDLTLRHAYVPAPATTPMFQPVYPSLHHPPKAEQLPPPAVPPQEQYHDSTFAFQPNGMQYPAYPPIPSPQPPNGYPNGAINSGYATDMQSGRPMYLLQQPFNDPNMQPTPAYMGQPSSNYNNQTWHNGTPAGYASSMPPRQHHHTLPGPMTNPPVAMNGYGWGYSNGGPAVIGAGQPMLMIPQGIQPFQQPYPPQPQQGMYPGLVQPNPTRPNPYPHSSSASSISSRSYHDASRPHSRGSTTSTRSAASSVRLGAMYPAGQTAGYRQTGLKGPVFNGLTSMGLGERRHPRGHSPSSVTTTSSRSSRHAASIVLNPPPQHQLPQRPDWAANNVPYHPSPMPMQNSPSAAPSTTDFPPLLRNGTNAEPMQVERAKIRPNGTVWNGSAVKSLQQNSITPPASVGDSSPRAVMIAPPRARTPDPPPPVENSVPIDLDPDFPRRVPSLRSAPTLFDPSAQRPISCASSNRSRAAPSSPSVSMTAEDVIEAKLAAVSLSVGVSIGPPALKTGQGVPSYAKIVRRE